MRLVCSCQEKWNEVISAQCPKTDVQYLVIGGCGFLGARLVEARMIAAACCMLRDGCMLQCQILLQRGERKIRVFDVVANPKFEGDARVDFVRGDVRQLDALKAACRGVDTVFATFAVIRFQERFGLPYQIAVRAPWHTASQVGIPVEVLV